MGQNGSTAGMDQVADELRRRRRAARRRRSRACATSPRSWPTAPTGCSTRSPRRRSPARRTATRTPTCRTSRPTSRARRPAFGLLAPGAAQARRRAGDHDPAAASTRQRRRSRSLKQGDGYPTYDTVGQAQRRKLSQPVDALAEPLSQVASDAAGLMAGAALQPPGLPRARRGRRRGRAARRGASSLADGRRRDDQAPQASRVRPVPRPASGRDHHARPGPPALRRVRRRPRASRATSCATLLARRGRPRPSG